MDYEVRAGLSSAYDDAEKGWVADDVHSESASRTLDYACMYDLFLLGHTIPDKTDDDYAAYILALHLGKPQTITEFLYERAMRTPFLIYNNATGFMEARNANGSWAGPDNGWTEGMCVCYVLTHVDLLILFFFAVNNKVINGLIHSTWCMIYPS